jgi:hypothetical protein
VIFALLTGLGELYTRSFVRTKALLPGPLKPRQSRQRNPGYTPQAAPPHLSAAGHDATTDVRARYLSSATEIVHCRAVSNHLVFCFLQMLLKTSPCMSAE